MLELQRQSSRKYKGKEYIKWVIVIPTEIIETLGWKDKEDLTSKIQDQELVIRKLGTEKHKYRRPDN